MIAKRRLQIARKLTSLMASLFLYTYLFYIFPSFRQSSKLTPFREQEFESRKNHMIRRFIHGEGHQYFCCAAPSIQNALQEF